MLRIVSICIVFILAACSSSPQRQIDSQSLIPVCVSWDKKRCGLLDRRGTPVTAPDYRNLFNQSDIWIGERLTGGSDIFDLNGRLLGNIASGDADKVKNGILRVLVNFEEKYYRYDGSSIPADSPQLYDILNSPAKRLQKTHISKASGALSYIDEFHNGFAEAHTGDWQHRDIATRKIALIDETGKMTTPLISGHRMFWVFDNKWLMWTKDTGYFSIYDLIDTSGNVLIQDISMPSKDHEIGITPFSQGNKCGVLNLDTLQETLIQSDNCLNAGGFSDGVVWISGRQGNNRYSAKTWLLVNTQGQILFEGDYRRPSKFHHGFAIVENHDGKVGIINQKNNAIFPFKYKEIKTPWLTKREEENFSDVWWFTEEAESKTLRLMNSDRQLIAKIQKNVIQKKDNPVADIVTVSIL